MFTYQIKDALEKAGLHGLTDMRTEEYVRRLFVGRKPQPEYKRFMINRERCMGFTHVTLQQCMENNKDIRAAGSRKRLREQKREAVLQQEQERRGGQHQQQEQEEDVRHKILNDVRKELDFEDPKLTQTS